LPPGKPTVCSDLTVAHPTTSAEFAFIFMALKFFDDIIYDLRLKT
jgi:hypothetical protein